eukprot:CAMPEP_0170566088 /NCGR_PEP_ID=MMETSP0211-20121228/79613_1 /TAXON_ID=311385 /ORGANISM="Pseudokeronopsis sp., Strain OXSARD2" /LENGTH=137 /DNA_ID=CAMNT_0010887163 /DNA_START=897 /DNA_END=1310 /DNA_ORIENTATION=+
MELTLLDQLTDDYTECGDRSQHTSQLLNHIHKVEGSSFNGGHTLIEHEDEGAHSTVIGELAVPKLVWLDGGVTDIFVIEGGGEVRVLEYGIVLTQLVDHHVGLVIRSLRLVQIEDIFNRTPFELIHIKVLSLHYHHD